MGLTKNPLEVMKTVIDKNTEGRQSEHMGVIFGGMIEAIEYGFANIPVQPRPLFMAMLVGSLIDMSEKTYEDFQDLSNDRTQYHLAKAKEFLAEMANGELFK